MTGDKPDTPIFSVIMIFHNEQRFLAEAVSSVAAQTGPSWELILVDDGSTDLSADIARRLAASFPNWMRCLAHADGRNHGMSASRNLGLQHARGTYITFLDADDVWLPDKLDCQFRALQAHPDVEVLVSPAEWWWSWDPDANRHDHRQHLVGSTGSGLAAVVDPPRLAHDFIVDEWQSICDLVMSRRLATELGGYEQSFESMFEDQVFHTKVLSSHPALVTGRHWYRYRQHRNACTTSSHATGGHIGARVRFLDWAVQHLSGERRPSTVDETHWRRYVSAVRQERRRALLAARRAAVGHRLRQGLRPLVRRTPLAEPPP